MNLSELTLDREGLARAIACEDAAFEAALREEAYRVKVATIGPEVYLRGLIEISNICVKNCLYCGIRRDIRCQRYELSDEEVLATARIAARRRFGSVVIQGGERTDVAFVRRITRLLKGIKSIDTGDDPPLGITLSLGEQSREERTATCCGSSPPTPTCTVGYILTTILTTVGSKHCTI